jgi:hypothetical protein
MSSKAPSQTHSLVSDSLRQAVCHLVLQNAILLYPARFKARRASLRSRLSRLRASTWNLLEHALMMPASNSKSRLRCR